MGGFVFVCAILDEMWDLGGLTLHFLVAWLLRKWGDRKFWVVVLVWFQERKLKSLLNYVG